jgi:hypothetical protein
MPEQQAEARRRRAKGATLQKLAKSYSGSARVLKRPGEGVSRRGASSADLRL